MAGVLAVCCGGAQAKNLFELDALVKDTGQRGQVGFTSLTDLLDAVSLSGLQNTVSTYTDISAAIGTLYVRGLPVQVEYRAESPILNFRVPSLGININFAGATRSASEQQFKDWMKGEGKNLLTLMLKEMARVSPVDPVAGNPASLMAQMGATDFSTAADSVYVGESTGGQMAGNNYALVGLEFGRYSAGGFSQNMTKLPLGWTWNLGNGYHFKLDAPLTYNDTEGAKTGSAALGGSLRVPVLTGWVLTPAMRVGAVGSADLGAAAVMYSASLSSRFSFAAGDWLFGMTNMVGLYRTQSLKYGDYEINYDLSNQMFRNGLDVGNTFPENWFGRSVNWRAWIIDTRFYGDALYIEKYQEFGFAAGTRIEFAGVSIEKANLGVTYTHGDNGLKGFRMNFGYKF
ncbi:hypothetical protein GCM10025771_35620 [Niveibacterium umoris]